MTRSSEWLMRAEVSRLRRRLAVVLALVTLVVGATSCTSSADSGQSSPGSAGAAPGDAPPDPVTFTPTRVPPSGPGLLGLTPQGLVLAPGGSAQLVVTLTDGDGKVTTAPPGVTLTSTAPTVANVSPSGFVLALTVGHASIRAKDVTGRVALADVDVSATIPSGPTGFALDPSPLTLNEGATGDVKVRVWRADGTPAAASDIAFDLSGDGLVDFTTAGRVTAKQQGAVVVAAHRVSDGVGLAGQGVVLVRAVGAGSFLDCNDPDKLVVGACWAYVGGLPWMFSKPGLTLDPLVVVWREHADVLCGGGSVSIQSPDSVTIRDRGVVDATSTGQFQSVAAGATTITTSVEGVNCDTGASWVSVMADMSGSWVGHCNDGATGTVTVNGWPTWVATSGATLDGGLSAHRGHLPVYIDGTGCFTQGTIIAACSGSDRIFELYTRGLGACGEGPECTFGLSTCSPQVAGIVQLSLGSGRWEDAKSAVYLGSDSFSTTVMTSWSNSVSCNFTRGTGSCGAVSCEEDCVAQSQRGAVCGTPYTAAETADCVGLCKLQQQHATAACAKAADAAAACEVAAMSAKLSCDEFKMKCGAAFQEAFAAGCNHEECTSNAECAVTPNSPTCVAHYCLCDECAKEGEVGRFGEGSCERTPVGGLCWVR